MFSAGDTVVVVVARGPDLTERIEEAFGRIKLVPKIVGSITMFDSKGPYEIVVTTVAASGVAEAPRQLWVGVNQ
jgi:hypothetical protein